VECSACRACRHVIVAGIGKRRLDFRRGLRRSPLPLLRSSCPIRASNACDNTHSHAHFGYSTKIRELLPHRFPFLLVDRIIEMEPERIVGIKNVTANEPHFMVISRIFR